MQAPRGMVRPLPRHESSDFEELIEEAMEEEAGRIGAEMQGR